MQRKAINKLEILTDVAKDAGLDIDKFLEDINDPQALKTIASDYEEAKANYGVFGVPTMFTDTGASAFVKMMPPPPAEQAREVFESVLGVINGVPQPPGNQASNPSGGLTHHPKNMSRNNGVEQNIVVALADEDLLVQALTHSSYIHEHPEAAQESNERLEFLGDSVLGFIIADDLYGQWPQLTEGEMTTLRAQLVSTQALASAAEGMELGKHLRLGRGGGVVGGED